MKAAPSIHEPIEGFASALRDLCTARAWEAARPGVGLVVTTDRLRVYEAIEIYPSGSDVPQWCIWRDASGGFYVDEWQRQERDRHFPTLSDALEFVSSKMAKTSELEPHPHSLHGRHTRLSH